MYGMGHMMISPIIIIHSKHTHAFTTEFPTGLCVQRTGRTASRLLGLGFPKASASGHPAGQYNAVLCVGTLLRQAVDERTLKSGLLLVETDCIVGRLFGLDEMLNNECGGCDDRSVSIDKIKNKK
jgi:hypothetical protein